MQSVQCAELGMGLLACQADQVLVSTVTRSSGRKDLYFLERPAGPPAIHPVAFVAAVALAPLPMPTQQLWQTLAWPPLLAV